MNILCKRYIANIEHKIDQHINKLCDCSKCVYNDSDFIFESLWSLLNLRGIRRRNYLSVQDLETIRQKFRIYVYDQIGKKEGINFFFFDLPIKTGKNKTSPDIGEYLMFAKLHTIAEQFKKIYPPGLHFYIVSDGFLFVESNFIREIDYKNYLKNCKTLLVGNNFKNVSIINGRLFFSKNVFNTDFIISPLLKNKIKERLFNLNSDSFSERNVSYYFQLRSSFEVNKQIMIQNLVHPKLGFYITKVGFKKENPVLSIYPFSSNISESPSRGKTYLTFKKGKIIPSLLKE